MIVFWLFGYIKIFPTFGKIIELVVIGKNSFMDVLTGINGKDRLVFKAFFEGNFSSIVMFADKYLNDMEAAADVAQECFIQLWRGDMTFETEDKVRGFLYTMARNLALNKLKHDSIVSQYVKRGMLESEEYLRDNVIEEEVYSIVYKAIDELAPQSKKVILLSLQELSNGEIAEQLGISINSVRTLKQNAYKKLKGLLRDYFYLLFLLDYTSLH